VKNNENTHCPRFILTPKTVKKINLKKQLKRYFVLTDVGYSKDLVVRCFSIAIFSSKRT